MWRISCAGTMRRRAGCKGCSPDEQSDIRVRCPRIIASLVRATKWPQSCNFTRTFINVGDSGVKTIEAEPAPVSVDLDQTALIIIGMQREFMSPCGFVSELGELVSR